jgi:hypothetical protein
MADKNRDKAQEEVEVGQQAVFPPAATDDPGLPPNVADPNKPLHEERGLQPPYPGDGTNTGLTEPRSGPEPGVTGIDRGTDPDVPAFIPDLVGPRTDADYDVPTQEERDEEAERLAKEAARQDAAGRRAADKDKK